MKQFTGIWLPILLLLLVSCRPRTVLNEDKISHSEEKYITGNPIIPGYFADPDIIEFEGDYYLYTTIDPWGGFEIAVWETDDFHTWSLRRINWPTQDQCTSLFSDGSMLSSPGVVRGSDGKFYMYVTGGGEIWSGVSEHPLGPWYNLVKNNQPLIPNLPGSITYNAGADCFIDDNGQVYLYWGTGQNWENGRCYAVGLADDMCTFTSEPVDITPPHYFETPSMLKISDRYYLLYSDGRCIDSSYKVRYAVSDNPLGPWAEGKNSPILKSAPENGITGPGHPCSFQYNNQYYMLYNRIEQPDLYSLLRQICIDSLKFDTAGYIEPVKPSDLGVKYFLLPSPDCVNLAGNKPVVATSILSEKFDASAITDTKPGTLWVAADSTDEASITIDLGKKMKLMNVYTWFEYPFGVYHYFIEYSSDSLQWELFADKLENEERGAPRIDSKPVKGRYIRLTLHRDERADLRPAIWEIAVD